MLINYDILKSLQNRGIWEWEKNTQEEKIINIKNYKWFDIIRLEIEKQYNMKYDIMNSSVDKLVFKKKDILKV